MADSAEVVLRGTHSGPVVGGRDKSWPLLRKVSGSIPRAPPGFRTQSHVTTSLSTGGGPVSYVQLSEGGFRVVYPLGLWSRFSGVVQVLFGYG